MITMINRLIDWAQKDAETIGVLVLFMLFATMLIGGFGLLIYKLMELIVTGRGGS